MAIETMNHIELIKKAKIILQREQPFFSFLLFHAKFIPVLPNHQQIDGMIDDINLKTNKKLSEKDRARIHELAPEQFTLGINDSLDIYYNPTFLEKHADSIKGLLIHEILHVVFKHTDREKEFKPDQKQLVAISCDAVINYIVNKMQYKLPMSEKEAVYINGNNLIAICGYKLPTPLDVSNKSWEEVYRELLKTLSKPQQQQAGQNHLQDFHGTEDSNGEGGEKEGEGESEGKGKSKKSLKEIEAAKAQAQANKKRVQEIVGQAINYAKLQGKMPEELERFIDSIYNTKTPWQKILKENIQSYIPYDYTFKKPSRRCYGIGTYLPHHNQKPSVKVTIAVDTSGSIGSPELDYFISEVYTLLEQFKVCEIDLLSCDASIHEEIKIKSDRDLPKMKKVSGGGGTDFRPIFKWMIDKKKNHQQEILIYLTDGYGSFPTHKPKHKTVWLCISKRNEMPPEKFPIGKVIYVEVPRNFGK